MNIKQRRRSSELGANWFLLCFSKMLVGCLFNLIVGMWQYNTIKGRLRYCPTIRKLMEVKIEVRMSLTLKIINKNEFSELYSQNVNPLLQFSELCSQFC